MIGRPVFLLQNISQFWDSTCKVSRLETPITPQLWCFTQLLWKFIRSVYLDWIQDKHLHIPGQNQTTTVPKLDIPKLDIDHYLELFGKNPYLLSFTLCEVNVSWTNHMSYTCTVCICIILICIILICIILICMYIYI